MPRRDLTFRPDSGESMLEHRLALSGGAAPALAGAATPTAGPVVFHHDGIDGLKLYHSFLRTFNLRVSAISTPMTALVSRAFTQFLDGYQQLPSNATPGTTTPALSGLLATLTQQVDQALTVKNVLSDQPSVVSGPKVSPFAQRSLVPYANEQIAQLGATLAAAPPVTGPSGQLQPADASGAANTAFNAIANAIAEYSIHPVLFRRPSDFYISPDFRFTIGFTSAPALSSPGYFVRGPGGQIIPGAILHKAFPA